MLPPLDPKTGLLPLGRYPCTAGEVKNAFVEARRFEGSTTRPGIWNDWDQALALLQASVTVHAAWLGGSFTTSKPNPSDIDVTFIINGEDLLQRSPAELRVVSLFKGNRLLKDRLSLKVDSYMFTWEPSGPGSIRPVPGNYHSLRGYWDDWWQRVRPAPGSPPGPKDSVPRRGYLEVLVSDYPS